MNDLQPYTVNMPIHGSIDDLWRIEFRTDGRIHWVNNVIGRAAHASLQRWHDQAPGRLICCHQCPVGVNIPCPHEERPEQRGWRWTDMTHFRIMPMREAV